MSTRGAGSLLSWINDLRTARPAPLNGYGGRAAVIDPAQLAAAGGHLYKHHDLYTVTAISQKRFLIVVPADCTDCFLSKAKISTDTGELGLYLSEAPTVTANGTPVTMRNANRNYPDDLSIDVYVDPTITDDGTQLEHHTIFGGNKEENSGFVGEDFWTLKSGTLYEFRMATTTTVRACVQISIAENG